MKRFGIFAVIMMLATVATNILGIWALIEFILYLVKDNPFNWTSLYWTIAMFIVTILIWVINFFQMFNKEP